MTLFPPQEEASPTFPAAPAVTEAPAHVVCYMPILSPSQLPQAKTAAKCFHRQNYPNRRLVVAASFDARAAFPEETVVVSYGPDAGLLLKLAQQRHPPREYFCTWLPHQISHYDRLLLLMACRRGGRVIGPTSHVVYHAPRNLAKVHSLEHQTLRHAALYPSVMEYRASWGSVPTPVSDYKVSWTKYDAPAIHCVDVWDRNSPFPESLFLQDFPDGAQNLWSLSSRDAKILTGCLKDAGLPDREIIQWNPETTR